MNIKIPKIIHHIAPKSKDRWHPIWDACYPSWKKQFPEFEHKLWNDEEDIEQFVHTHYPQHYDMFMEFPAHIMRIDFVRFCLLHHFGGIYSDMDMFCYQNFYGELSHPLHIIEAPYGVEFLESSLMVSIPGHKFWEDCMELSREVFYGTVKKYNIKIPFNSDRVTQHLITTACGPNLICRVWKKWVKSGSDQLQALSGVVYNNHGMSYREDYRTKHLMTGMWGKESVNHIQESSDLPTLHQTLDSVYIREIKRYAELNGVESVADFDFYKDYTNGGMKTHFVPNFDANDIDAQPNASFINYE